MESYYKDGRRGNPDFEALNEVYLVTMGDKFRETTEKQQSSGDNLVLVDINLNIEERYISESFLWDSEEVSNIQIKIYSNHFLGDILREKNIDLDKEAYQGKSIYI